MEGEELQLSLKDRLFVSPAGQWIYLHRNLLINVGIFVFLLIGWAVLRTVRAPNFDAICRAQTAYAAWKAKPDDDELYRQFEKALAAVPEMKHALGGEMAQSLLIAGKSEAAQKFCREPLKELRAIAPDYAEFSETSLLIAQKRWQEALEKSVSLKERLSATTHLYLQNAIRIASLQRQLNNPAGELAAWRDLEQAKSEDLALLGFSIKDPNVLPVHFASYLKERTSFLEQSLAR